MANIDWDQVTAKLPTARTAEEKARRLAIWNQIDVNQNSYVSLAVTKIQQHKITQNYSVLHIFPTFVHTFYTV